MQRCMDIRADTTQPLSIRVSAKKHTAARTNAILRLHNQAVNKQAFHISLAHVCYSPGFFKCQHDSTEVEGVVDQCISVTTAF